MILKINKNISIMPFYHINFKSMINIVLLVLIVMIITINGNDSEYQSSTTATETAATVTTVTTTLTQTVATTSILTANKSIGYVGSLVDGKFNPECAIRLKHKRIIYGADSECVLKLEKSGDIMIKENHEAEPNRACLLILEKWETYDAKNILKLGYMVVAPKNWTEPCSWKYTKMMSNAEQAKRTNFSCSMSTPDYFKKISSKPCTKEFGPLLAKNYRCLKLISNQIDSEMFYNSSDDTVTPTNMGQGNLIPRLTVCLKIDCTPSSLSSHHQYGIAFHWTAPWKHYSVQSRTSNASVKYSKLNKNRNKIKKNNTKDSKEE